LNIKFGHRRFKFPSPELTELTDHSHLLGDLTALKQALANDGYLLLRGLIDRATVLKARATSMIITRLTQTKQSPPVLLQAGARK